MRTNAFFALAGVLGVAESVGSGPSPFRIDNTMPRLDESGQIVNAHRKTRHHNYNCPAPPSPPPTPRPPPATMATEPRPK